MKRAALINILLLCVVILSGEPRYILQTGHSGSVTGLDYQSSGDFLVSAGKDGYVKVSEGKTGKIIYNRRMICDTILFVCAHPQKTYFSAAVEINGTYAILTYDWNADHELLNFKLQDKPLFLTYSPLGSYLAVCVEHWRSIYLFDASTGTLSASFASGFGIVSFVAFSSKETTLMAYQATGKITYWEIAKSAKVKEIKTASGLAPIFLTKDKRFLIVASEDKISAINAVSGKEISSLPSRGNYLFSADRVGSSFGCWTPAGQSGGTFHFYTVSDGSIKTIKPVDFDANVVVGSICFTGTALFAGSVEGEIFKLTGTRLEKVIAKNLVDLFDIAPSLDALTLASFSRFFILKGFSLASNFTTIAPDASLEFILLENPDPGSAREMFFSEQTGLFFWNLDDAMDSLSLVNLDTMQFKNTATLKTGLLKLIMYPDFYLSIDKEGRCQIVSLKNKLERFSVVVENTLSSAMISDGELLVGKMRSNDFDNALSLITLNSRKIRPIQDSATAVTDIVFNAKCGAFCYFSLEHEGDEITTALKFRRISFLNKENVLMSRSSKNTDTSLAADPDSARFYFSFGGNGLFCWDGSEVTVLEPSPYAIKRIHAFQNHVFALNENSSVTIWNQSTGKISCSFYLFEDLSWIIITSEGRFLAHGEISRNIAIYETNLSSAEALKRYRLNMSIINRAPDSP